jgi:DNA-binding beta-propeller fold protein YncE
VLAVVAALALVVALAVAAGNGVRVSRGRASVAVAGRAWTVELAVRPASFGGRVLLTATGPTRLVAHARARGGHGSYRARLVFPAAGVWKLAATAGDARASLGSVRVRLAPLVLDQPTGIDSLPDGSLLVVESGLLRLVRVDLRDDGVRELARLDKPWGVARAPSGSIYVSDRSLLKRIDPGRAPRVVARAEPGVEIGPVTVAPGGDVYYSTASALYRLRQGAVSPERIAAGTQLASPHGLAVAPDGSLLVSDTNDDRVLRVEQSGAVTTFAAVGHPRGLDVAPDGFVYLAAGDEQRVVRFDAAGERLGPVGPAFEDVYALTVGAGGAVYAIDIGADTIRRIPPG